MSPGERAIGEDDLAGVDDEDAVGQQFEGSRRRGLRRLGSRHAPRLGATPERYARGAWESSERRREGEEAAFGFDYAERQRAPVAGGLADPSGGGAALRAWSAGTGSRRAEPVDDLERGVRAVDLGDGDRAVERHDRRSGELASRP